MSTQRQYSELGLVIPHKTNVLEEWAAAQTVFHTQGFLHVRQHRHNLQVVQSKATQDLYMIKLVKATGDNDDADSDGFKYDVPPEIRVSTTPRALVRLPQRDYFPSFLMWQRWTESQWALYMP